jgi:outer membrane protein
MFLGTHTMRTQKLTQMKRLFFAIITMASLVLPASAQKFALVDMEYILNHIPAYERAGEQLNQVSRKWQAEVEVLQEEAQTMYKKYQAESVFLSDEQKTKSEEAIIAKEKEASDLKKKYFGSEGELFKKRQSLMAPIQEEIYNAVKDICESKGYQLVIDRASGASIIYASPKIDISDEILLKLGYLNK